MAPVSRPGGGSGLGIAGGTIAPINTDQSVPCMADVGSPVDRAYWLGAERHATPTLTAHYSSMDGDAGLRCRAGGCTLLLRGIDSESRAGQLFIASVHAWPLLSQGNIRKSPLSLLEADRDEQHLDANVTGSSEGYNLGAVQRCISCCHETARARRMSAIAS